MRNDNDNKLILLIKGFAFFTFCLSAIEICFLANKNNNIKHSAEFYFLFWWISKHQNFGSESNQKKLEDNKNIKDENFSLLVFNL